MGLVYGRLGTNMNDLEVLTVLGEELVGGGESADVDSDVALGGVTTTELEG